MPKHALSFKQFLGTRNTQPTDRKERSVNELLTNSRQSTALTVPGTATASIPPALPSTAVTTAAPSSSRPIWEDGAAEEYVHPAELLRREREAHRHAVRSVAGPAPPRSWRAAAPKPETEKDTATWRGTDAAFVVSELRVASAFLRGTQPDPAQTPQPSQRGPPSMVTCCINVVLGTIAGKGGGALQDEYSAAEMADAMLLAARPLDIGLRRALLDNSALRPAGDALRLSDTALRILLEHEDMQHLAANYETEAEFVSSDDEEEDWDDDPPPTLAHLSLATHTAPLRMLQDTPRLLALSLTTLDLAFATLPPLDRLVNALPPGLRALGLAGVRSSGSYASWSRDMAILGRKMTVLNTLDLSHSPILVEPILHALFGAPETKGKHLPSLRRLAMRGNVISGNEDENPNGVPLPVAKEAVNRGRARWVDILA